MLAWVALASCGVAILTLSTLVFLQYRNYKKLTIKFRILQTKITAITPQLQSLLHADVKIGKRFSELQIYYDKLSDKMSNMSSAHDNTTSYSQAVKLAEMGASIEEIKATCNLSTAECELVSNLQGYKKLLQA